MADKRDEILRSVLSRHKLVLKDVLGKRRDSYLVDARRDAAKQLYAAGFTVARIAQILKKSHWTAKHYIDDTHADRRNIHCRARLTLQTLDSHSSAAIHDIARELGISPVTLAARWITESLQRFMEAEQCQEK
jgi:hypothetical protein